MKRWLKDILRPTYYRFVACKVMVQVQIARIYHRRVLSRVRAKFQRGEPLRVLFLETSISKWKVQSLYERMRNDPRFEPMVGVSTRDEYDRFTGPSSAITEGMKMARQYYEKHGCKCVEVFDAERHELIDLRRFTPDIVFYQQSWYDYECHHAREVSKFAVTCYIPYFVPNYGDIKLDTRLPTHRFLSYYFTLNEGWSDYYKKSNLPFYQSGRYIAVGHTMLDQLNGEKGSERRKPCVIYAPHWTFVHPKHKTKLHYSTFLQNGREILTYAKNHPEFDWVFKPHPALLTHLVQYGAWSQNECEQYIDAWRSLGRVCMDGDYMQLFNVSSAMITDCGSFLTEYGVTGKPLIHLISSQNTLKPANPSAELYGTYYQVHSLEEMYRTFSIVLERGNDYKREERIAAVRKANLVGVNAAENVIKFLAEELGGSN